MRGIYLVTDAALCGERGVTEVVRAAVAGGVSTVQIREKSAGLGDQLRLVEQVAAAIDGRALLVVNDRLDVVLQARRRGLPVDGVHLGQDDDTVERARAELGPDAIIGLTAHTPEQFLTAEILPPGTVDYLGVGAIHATATKPDHPPALGVEGFRRLAASTPFPCVAIGGIQVDHISALHQAGAAGAAVVSAICAADDPEAVARHMAEAWRASREVPTA